VLSLIKLHRRFFFLFLSFSLSTLRASLSPLRRELSRINPKEQSNRSKILCSNFDLVDAWRFQHQNDERFSWANSSGKIKCRLDFWLISKQLLCRVIKTGNNACCDSDHSPVTISTGPEERQGQKGPGFSKFNNSLLEYEESVLRKNEVYYFQRQGEIQRCY